MTLAQIALGFGIAASVIQTGALVFYAGRLSRTVEQHETRLNRSEPALEQLRIDFARHAGKEEA